MNLHSFLQSLASDISQEPEHIKEIGLPRCIGTDEKHSRTEVNIHLMEVSPILQFKMFNVHIPTFN